MAENYLAAQLATRNDKARGHCRVAWDFDNPFREDFVGLLAALVSSALDKPGTSKLKAGVVARIFRYNPLNIRFRSPDFILALISIQS